MVALMAFYGITWSASANDIEAVLFSLNLNYITYFNRAFVFVGPVIAFWITRRWCIALQRADQNRLLHGYESGVIMRSPEGAYAEKHLPISVEEAYTLTARDRDEVLLPPTEADENGIPNRQVALMRLRAKASELWFAHDIQKPTREELEEAHHHAAHELAAAQNGHGGDGGQDGGTELEEAPADGHQFDGVGDVADNDLRRH